jgi:hypothetical protein
VDTQEQARRPVPQLTHRRQDGWVGLVVLLLALVIVAVLAQTALKRYGLLTPAATPATKTSRLQAPDASGQVDAATTTPRDALERARGMENTVRKQADDLGKQIDDAAK